MLRNCTLPDLRSCFKCGKQGHIATRCQSNVANTSSGRNDNIKEIKMLQSYNDIYKKTAKVDGIFVKCYVYCYVMCCDVLCYVRYRHWKPS